MDTDQLVQARNNLKRACDETIANQSLKSIKNTDGSWTTYCNIGLYEVFSRAGWPDLLPKTSSGSPYMANDIVNWLLTHQVSWKVIDGPTAHMAANQGQPTIACQEHPVHGHVTHIYPADEMGYSPSLQKEVPFCANIGKVPKDQDSDADANCVCKISEAFPVAEGEPLYFTFVAMTPK